MDYPSSEWEGYMQELLDAELLLLGRVTHESFAGAWPSYEGEFADKDELRAQELKAQDGGPILVGASATLCTPWSTTTWSTSCC